MKDEKMKQGVRVAFLVVAVGGAFCVSVSKARDAAQVADAVQTADSAPVAQGQLRPATAKLLGEFLTPKVWWEQGDIGQKLVTLGDRAVVPKLLPLLQSQDRRLRSNAGRVLAGLGDDRGFFAVLAELKDTSPGTQRKTDSVTSDGKHPNFLRQMWQDRYYAAHVLGQIGDKRAVPALIETLPDKSINYQSAIILGKLGDKSAIPALRTAFQHAENNRLNPNGKDMKLWAGYGLMLLDDPLGMPAVVAVLKNDPSWNQRRHAAQVLGDSGNKDSVPFLISALHDKQVNVRLVVIRSLAKLGDKRAIPALKEMLKDNAKNTSWAPTTIAKAAAQAIEEIKSSTASAQK